MDSLPPFARVIKSHRARLNMSRSQLAEASELSYPYISQLETGLRKPSRKAAHAIAGALGISVEALERTIPADTSNVEEIRRAEAFSDSLLSAPEAISGSAMSLSSPPERFRRGERAGSREDLIGDLIDILDEFEPAERLDVLADVQKRVMQRMLEQRGP